MHFRRSFAMPAVLMMMAVRAAAVSVQTTVYETGHLPLWDSFGPCPEGVPR